MLIVGITGSIASGKTYVTDFLRKNNYNVFDADFVAHQAYYNTQLLSLIHDVFPEYKSSSGVELREEISKSIFNDPDRLRLLESVIHPYIRNQIDNFIDINKQNNEPIIFLDIPLLFEGGLNALCHIVLVTYCAKEILVERLTKRGYNESKILKILAKQLSQEEKVKKADYVIDTSGSFVMTDDQLNSVLQQLLKLV